MNKIINLLLITWFFSFDGLMAADISLEPSSLQAEPLWGATLFFQPIDQCQPALSDDNEPILVEELCVTVRSIISFLELEGAHTHEDFDCIQSPQPIETFLFPSCYFCLWGHHPYFICPPKHHYFMWRDFQARLHFEHQRRIRWVEWEHQRRIAYHEFLRHQWLGEE